MQEKTLLPRIDGEQQPPAAETTRNGEQGPIPNSLTEQPRPLPSGILYTHHARGLLSGCECGLPLSVFCVAAADSSATASN